ncbi:WhiB family transcriptional regulator [Streptomyces sp. NPDC005548]|uniref:WhiB family transcriptional regulator n=1 Tax=Streptomyces sp. NPDC005548 TaxID=3364724 RepID=UPI0036965D0C
MTGTSRALSVAAAREAWEDHPRFRYAGCLPDPVAPSRSAGDLSLPVGAHHAPDADGGESQPARRRREAAAIEVCLNCPVMVQCDAYANSITVDGKLAEPDGVWGGRTALERHRAFIGRRHEVAAAVPDDAVRTPQKLAVLRALVAHRTPEAVAAAAGMDVRTANWQRSRLVTQLGLPAGASREVLLEAAVARGLLEAPEESGVRLRLHAPRRDRFTDIEGQLALWEAELTDTPEGPVGLADVTPLPIISSKSLEAAA